MAASKATKLDQSEIAPDHKIGVAISNPAKKTMHSVDLKQLFISNLADNIVETDLMELFGQYGVIQQIRLIKNERGRSKGIAYIHFEKEEGAKKGLALNGHLLDNKVIIVTIADPNKRTAFVKK